MREKVGAEMSKRKRIMIDITDDSAGYFGTVLNCAVRYCIGRETYMPGLVTDWIMGHCSGVLKEKTLFVMKRDIDESTARNALGWECDVKTWQEFRRWIVQEEERIAGDDKK